MRDKFEKQREDFFTVVNLDSAQLAGSRISNIIQPLTKLVDLLEGLEKQSAMEASSESLRQKIAEWMTNSQKGDKEAGVYLKEIHVTFTGLIEKALSDPAVLLEVPLNVNLSVKGVRNDEEPKNDTRTFDFRFGPAKGGYEQLSAKELSQLIFLNMIVCFGIEPKRFGKCENQKCSAYFYKAKSTKLKLCPACARKTKPEQD